MRTTLTLKLTLLAVVLPGVVLLAVAPAQAHYLWVGVSRSNQHGDKAEFFFEHSPAPGDGKYLDPFLKRAKAWAQTTSVADPQPLKLVETKRPKLRWLTAELPSSEPCSVQMTVKWGVYRYGQTDVLLHYYGRNLDATGDDLAKLSRNQQLELDLPVRLDGGEVTGTLLWQGKPVAGREVSIGGPGLFAKVKTDDDGRVRFTPKKPGLHRLRSSIEEDTAGEFEGKAFSKVRRHITMTLRLPAGE